MMRYAVRMKCVMLKRCGRKPMWLSCPPDVPILEKTEMSRDGWEGKLPAYHLGGLHFFSFVENGGDKPERASALIR